MLERQKTLQGAGILILLFTIIMLFNWYSTQNSKRIEKQNLNYAMDSARQTVVHIDIEFSNALNRVSTYSYFLGQSLSEPSITAEMLRDMEANALFDAFRFTDAEGVTLASDGRTADSHNEDYFISGMKGESGMAVILDSPLFNGPIISFYAPVEFQGEVIGVLRGVYAADEYLKKMISTSYFGVDAEAFLCLGDGTIISSTSAAQGSSGEIFNLLLDGSIADAATVEKVKSVFETGGEEGFF